MTSPHSITKDLLTLRDGLDDEPNVEVTANVADSSVPDDPDEPDIRLPAIDEIVAIRAQIAQLPTIARRDETTSPNPPAA